MTNLDAIGLDEDELEAFASLSEDEQRAYIDMLQQVLDEHWSLTPKQELAEALWGKVDWLLYGGSAAGGKSEFACWHANRLSQKIDGHVSLVVRQSIPELRRSLILRMIARNKQFDLGCKLKKPDGITGFYYGNNSVIECGYLATDEHLGNYLSAEYDLIIIDEATQLTPDQIVGLAARLRTTKEKAARGARPHLGMFTNPGDVAHAWMYSLLVVPTNYGQKVIVYNVSNGVENAFPVREYEAPIPLRDATLEQIEDVLIPWANELEVECDPQTELAVAFVPSRATDNPHIDPSYLKHLNGLPERRRRQLRDGDWDVFEGQYFHEWNASVHVKEPFDIPDGWALARGADFGSRAPWCCLWGAWDNDGNCYIYRESYGAGMTPEMQAQEAARLSSPVDLATGRTKVEKYERTVADPSVFSDKRGAGRTIAQLWGENGFRVTRAKNDRIAGWQNVRQYLWDPVAAKPRLYVMSNCHHLIRTLPLQRYDRTKQEDLDTTAEDHAVDALRYLLATRPMGVRERPAKVGMTLDQRFHQMMRKSDKRGKRSWM